MGAVFRRFAIVVALVGVLVLVFHAWDVAHPRQHSEDAYIATATRIIASPNMPADRRIAAYSQRAYDYRQSGQTAKAIADYRAIQTLEPPGSDDWDDAQRGVIGIYSAQGNAPAAMTEWKRFAANPSHEYASLLVRARIYHVLHDHAHELADLDAAIAREPENWEGFLARARYFDQRGDHAKALADLAAAQKLTPDWDEIHAERMMVYLHGWNLPAAWHELTAVVSEVSAEQKRRLADDRALFEMRRLDYKHAIPDFTALIAAHPQSAYYRIQRADLYLWSGARDKAFADYKAAIFDEPTQPEPHFELGYALFNTQQFEASLPEYKTAIAFEERPWYIYKNRGLSEFALGRYDDAAADFTTALKANPQAVYAAILLHMTRLGAHQDDKAEFAKNMAAIATHDWPWPVADYLAGHIDRKQLMAAAGKAGLADARRDHVCEANYFSGQVALDRGDRATAIPALQSAAKSCHPGRAEQPLAIWALKQAGIGG